MASSTAILIPFAVFLVISIAKAQDRAPHGLVYESPIAMSPKAYEFFHPENQMASTKSVFGGAEIHSPFPLAATVESDVAHESSAPPQAGKARVGPGAIAGIVFGVAVSVFLAMGVYYVAIVQRTKLNRTKTAQPDA